MATGNSSIDLAVVPFDQYSRQLVVKNIIDQVFRTNSRKIFTILDVGGYMGKTAEFLPNDKIEILDVFNIKAPNYTKGDATDVNKEDESYDFVCSFDVLEHIPRIKREAFITESARLCKTGFFIAAPTDDKDGIVSLAEREANDVFKIINKQDHRWLKEHIDFGIPTGQEIGALLKKHGLHYTAIKSNEIINWFAVQSTFFVKSVLEKSDNFLDNKYLSQFYEFHRAINETYNKNYDSLEGRQDVLSYRTVYFVSRDQEMVNKVANYLNKNAALKSHDSIGKAQIEIYSSLFRVIASTVSILQEEGNRLKKKERQLPGLKQELEYMDNYIKDLQNSRSWKMTRPFRSMVHLIDSTRKKGQ
jgi:2-polyprenyl-3-methyl-5-hydroxy-6-metoxy-1,4-benzoquinol methylase